ncbi:hypothetical protein QBC35DRAFT_145478 [Podospora australis]|uniref:Uncharacterized protein n=1 Tax=Podospora australis TaxID=1536484 RepID=A0AAN6WXI6_9PEZI|nr:hypothetical protein QBC35DRAFT_145478 [Podospora australis]
MCTQYDWVFSCGHHSFAKFDNCQYFGTKCFGAGGNHLPWHKDEICSDCKLRPLDPNPHAQANDPYRQRRAAQGH